MLGYKTFGSVPIIHQDLRQEESIVQITLALDYLDQVSTNIFKHIQTAVGKQKVRLNKLQERSDVVKAKVNKLAGTNKATKVFSSAKYPANEVYKDYECTVETENSITNLKPNIKIKSKQLPLESHDIKDKLQFFHMKVKNKLLRKNVEVTPGEGLGSLPDDLDSVSSLLLFNTSENLYKKYVMLDPLGFVTKTKQILEDEGKREIGAAPQTMMQNDPAEYKLGANYFYSPTLEEVPQLDMPLDLPDLPGIAGDLRYSVDSGPSIAPSVTTTPAISELPSLFPDSPSAPADSALPDTAPPPPPPPPPPLLPDISPPSPPPTQVPVKEPVVSIDAPQESPKSTSSIKEPLMVESKVDPGGKESDARANLMEAIRNAGGSGKAKLRSVVDRKQEAKRMRQEEEDINKEGGGNLMADLHAKLALRRKGISGLKQEGSAGAIERVLNMIPPPPVKESETEDDEEWED